MEDNIFEKIKQMSIADYCLGYLGYSVNRKKDSKLWRSLVSPRGEKIITKSVPNAEGAYFFSGTSEDTKGTLIDLLHKLEGWDWHQIRGMVEPDYVPPAPTFQAPSKTVNNADNRDIVRRHVAKDTALEPLAINYLSRRGISQETLDFFNLYPTHDAWALPLFTYKDGEWCEQTAIKYFFKKDGLRSRLFAKGLEKKDSVSVLLPKKIKLHDIDTVAIFESPVDALSYAQIDGLPPLLYLSTCGALTHDVLANLPGALRSLGIKRVILAQDSDEAGEAMAVQLYKALKAIDVAIERHKGLKKDFNDMLLNPLEIPKKNQLKSEKTK